MSKITGVKTHPISIPLEKTLWTAHEELKDSSVILVEVRTDDGVAGYGQIHGSPLKGICEWVARLGEIALGMEATANVAVWDAAPGLNRFGFPSAAGWQGRSAYHCC